MVDTPPEVRFLLHTEKMTHDPGILQVVACPIHVTGEGIRNPSSSDYPPSPLADFQVRTMIARDQKDINYSTHREYRNVFSVETSRAEVMVKHLRALDRGMEKLERQFGFAEDFPTNLARVASLLKISQFGWLVEKGGSSWTYDGNKYCWGDATFMHDWVALQVAEFRKVAA